MQVITVAHGQTTNSPQVAEPAGDRQAGPQTSQAESPRWTAPGNLAALAGESVTAEVTATTPHNDLPEPIATAVRGEAVASRQVAALN